MICANCGRRLRDTSGCDPNVPWVHEGSGNEFCDVDCPEDAVMFAGTPGRVFAEPVAA